MIICFCTAIWRRVHVILILQIHLTCQMLTRVDWRVEFYILLSRIHKMLYRAYIDNHKVILEILVYHFFLLECSVI